MFSMKAFYQVNLEVEVSLYRKGISNNFGPDIAKGSSVQLLSVFSCLHLYIVCYVIRIETYTLFFSV